MFKINRMHSFLVRYFKFSFKISNRSLAMKQLHCNKIPTKNQKSIFLLNLPALQSSVLRNPYFFTALYSSRISNRRPENLDSIIDYENVSEETLQSLYDRFEEILQNSSFEDWDVNYSNGVLTISVEKSCVYVINKQTPNRQIWLSSPVSGPKRYDYINGVWIYKHNEVSLHQLLSEELTHMLQKDADFLVCMYGS